VVGVCPRLNGAATREHYTNRPLLTVDVLGKGCDQNAGAYVRKPFHGTCPNRAAAAAPLRRLQGTINVAMLSRFHDSRKMIEVSAVIGELSVSRAPKVVALCLSYYGLNTVNVPFDAIWGWPPTPSRVTPVAATPREVLSIAVRPEWSGPAG